MKTDVHLSRGTLLRMRNISDKSGTENQNTFYIQKIVPEIRALHEIMCKNVAREDRIIRHRKMLCTCRITRARIHRHTQNISCLLLFYGSNGYPNATQCYVIVRRLSYLVLNPVTTSICRVKLVQFCGTCSNNHDNINKIIASAWFTCPKVCNQKWFWMPH
jgi:hypothetical protein